MIFLPDFVTKGHCRRHFLKRKRMSIFFVKGKREEKERRERVREKERKGGKMWKVVGELTA